MIDWFDNALILKRMDILPFISLLYLYFKTFYSLQLNNIQLGTGKAFFLILVVQVYE